MTRMDIDEIITLDDNLEYVLLLKAAVEGNNYFLASKMINEDPTEEYHYFKEIYEDGEYMVEEIEDLLLIDKIKNEFGKQILS